MKEKRDAMETLMKKRIIPKIGFVCLNCFVLLFWIWSMYMTQYATLSNTYQRQERIQEVKVQHNAGLGTDRLYIITEDECYMLDTRWRDAERSHSLADVLCSAEEPITVTVWRRLRWGLAEYCYGVTDITVSQVVDLRDANQVYWDIEQYNKYQRGVRIGSVIVGVFCTVAVLGIDSLFWIFKGRSKKNH